MKRISLVLLAMAAMAITCTQAHAQFTYQNDDGTADNSVGLTSGGTFAWGNMFSVNSMDGPILNSIEIGYGAGIAGSTVIWRVFNDDDGDPTAGLALLSSGSYSVVNDDFETNGPAIDVISAGGVNVSNDSFLFITAEITHAGGLFPAAIDQTNSLGQSWITLGPGNADDWGLNATTGVIDSFGLPGNWIIRGNAVVPEPSAFAMIALLGGLAAARRRR